MAIKTPLTKERLKTHLQYNAWKYALAIVLSIFGWDLLYTTTAYRSPENKRIDFWVVSDSVNADWMDSVLDSIWHDVVPEVETVQGASMMADDTYKAYQMQIHLMAGDGDLYMLPAADFKTYASQGFFMDLQPMIDAGLLDITGIDTAKGMVAEYVEDEEAAPTGRMCLYGIPTDSLYGFMDQMYVDNRNMVLCIYVVNGNTDNVVTFTNELIQRMRADMPDWLNATPVPTAAPTPAPTAAGE